MLFNSLEFALFLLQEGAGYINFKADSVRYRTTDGVHLYASEGSRLTLALCDSIKALKQHEQ